MAFENKAMPDAQLCMSKSSGDALEVLRRCDVDRDAIVKGAMRVAVSELR